MNCFTPSDELSASLLKSIPRKVFHWLNRLEQDLSELGAYNGVSWKFSPDCGKISFLHAGVVMSISWDGFVDSITEIQASDERFCNISENLDWFTEIEKSVYDVLTSYEESLERSDFDLIKNGDDPKI